MDFVSVTGWPSKNTLSERLIMNMWKFLAISVVCSTVYSIVDKFFPDNEECQCD